MQQQLTEEGEPSLQVPSNDINLLLQQYRRKTSLLVSGNLSALVAKQSNANDS